ncbi:MAG TPA: B12-binding domain-containing radical SAM protein [Vicinamibacterales bacterium]
MDTHPKGTNARILLTSVFKPFAVDDEFGSREINPVELYHNQVTREQGPFSLRMFHRTWGLQFLQHNVSAPCTLLDFPTRERFVRELTSEHYDIVGISAIVVNVGKVREMCRLVREHSPSTTIVVGGHVAAIANIHELVDADHIVRGEGVRWLRTFLGEDPDQPVRHPVIPSSFGFRTLGLNTEGGRSATIIPSVGCPLGCNFCTTSAFFGGKGKSTTFYDSGEDIYKVMCEAEEALKVKSFFMMDENFLLFKKRAMELLECMKRDGKVWSMYVFSSANAIRKYKMSELVELGIDWIWLGLESASSGYAKLNGADTLELVRELQAHGICVLGSSIIGLEHQTPDNIHDDIDRAVAHETVFHQFMLYTPMPGTPLHEEVSREGRLLEDIDIADIHGQYKFNFKHPAISRDESKLFLDHAFRTDYERNGPSLFRLARTMLARCRKYASYPDARVRARIAADAAKLRGGYGAMLWAMEKYLRENNRNVSVQIREVRLEIEQELGGWSAAAHRLLGPVLLWTSRRDARKHPRGRRIEPRTFVERFNWT